MKAPESTTSEHDGLSRREREVLELLAKGNGVDAIGGALVISRHTVRNHLKAIYRKLGVRSQIAAARRWRAMSPETAADGQPAPELPALGALTGREREVLRLLLQGARVAKVSAELGITANTVRNHLKAIYRKLGVGSRIELMRLLEN
jgi:DNA-binding NarL/FixJ family response regulator